ncbi:hypothetical protein Lal_00039295 [Lupinus albus]|nr:hypothetical protein Lal_00039295 [Lupinus albus]
MAGRGRGTSQNILNDLLTQMVAALQQVNENLRSLNQNAAPNPSSHPLVPPGPAEYPGLDEFWGFVPDAANEWVQNLERIFRTMGCCDVQRVTYASYMLANEAEIWWEMTRRQMEMEGQVIVWVPSKRSSFRNIFLLI